MRINKNDPIPRVAPSQKAELFWHALYSGHNRGLFAGAASLFLLSLLSSFSFLSLLPSSLCFVLKNGWYSHTDGTGGHLGSICWLWTRVKCHEASILRSEASKPVSWRGQNAKIYKTHCISKIKNSKRYVTHIGRYEPQ